MDNSVYADDIVGDLLARLRRFPNTNRNTAYRFRCIGNRLRNLIRCLALFIDNSGDSGCTLIDLGYGFVDILDGRDRFDRRGLDTLDSRPDILRGRSGLLGQFLDFGGYDRKALACFTRSGSFDRRVQRE